MSKGFQNKKDKNIPEALSFNSKALRVAQLHCNRSRCERSLVQILARYFRAHIPSCLQHNRSFSLRRRCPRNISKMYAASQMCSVICRRIKKAQSLKKWRSNNEQSDFFKVMRVILYFQQIHRVSSSREAKAVQKSYSHLALVPTLKDHPKKLTMDALRRPLKNVLVRHYSCSSDIKVPLQTRMKILRSHLSYPGSSRIIKQIHHRSASETSRVSISFLTSTTRAATSTKHRFP